MNHETWLERAEIYAVGALDGREKTDFEKHLETGCALCTVRVSEASEVLGELSAGLDLQVPGESLKQAVLARIESETQHEISPARERGFAWAFAFAGVLAAAAVLVQWNQPALKERFYRFQAAQLQDANVVALKGLESYTAASGEVLWEGIGGRGILILCGLPELPQGQVYELWAIAGGEPVAAGTFFCDKAGRGFLRTPVLGSGISVDKFAVTIEPAGGLNKPSGPMVLLGQVS